MTSMQTLIRGYLSLSDVHKITVAKSLGIYKDDFHSLSLHEADLKIFEAIKEKSLYSQLWIEINKIKPFEGENPFMERETALINDMDYIKNTCKIGQGSNCCKYLVAGAGGFECMRVDASNKMVIDNNWNESKSAQGDNCAGYKNKQS